MRPFKSKLHFLNFMLHFTQFDLRLFFSRTVLMDYIDKMVPWIDGFFDSLLCDLVWTSHHESTLNPIQFNVYLCDLVLCRVNGRSSWSITSKRTITSMSYEWAWVLKSIKICIHCSESHGFSILHDNCLVFNSRLLLFEPGCKWLRSAHTFEILKRGSLDIMSRVGRQRVRPASSFYPRSWPRLTLCSMYHPLYLPWQPAQLRDLLPKIAHMTQFLTVSDQLF